VFMHEESPSLGFDTIGLYNPLDHFHVSPMYLQASSSPKYYIDVPIDNLMICNGNVDLGYEDNMFNMLGENVDNFMSLSYCSGYNVSLDPYFMYIMDAHRKSSGILSLIPLLIFL